MTVKKKGRWYSSGHGIGPSQMPLPVRHTNSTKIDMHPPLPFVGIRTRNTSKRTALDPAATGTSKMKHRKAQF